jgi:hypothetical protein
MNRLAGRFGVLALVEAAHRAKLLTALKAGQQGMTVSPNLIGIGAGLVAAALFASLANNSMLAAMLFYLTPLPILLAGIGWGARAAQIAFATATLLVAIVLTLTTAVAFALCVGLPGVLLSHLLLLRRQHPALGAGGASRAGASPAVEWYPLGRIIAWASLMAGGLVALGLILLGGDGEGYRHAVRGMFDETALKQLQTLLGADFTQEQLDRFAERFARYVLPAFAAAFWLLIMLANLWLAAKSASISGQLARPVPSFAELDYPPWLLGAFALAAGLSFASGLAGLTGTAFAGALACAYLILGLAVVHGIAAGSQLKLLMLGLLYTGLFLTPWVAPILVLVGVAEPFLQLRRRAIGRAAPPASGAGPRP